MTNPEAPISRLLRAAAPLSLPFVAPYAKLAGEFASSVNLVNGTSNAFMNKTGENLSYHKLIDPQHARAYARVKPTMEAPQFYTPVQQDRILFSRFGTGSHSLRRESCRWNQRV